MKYNPCLSSITEQKLNGCGNNICSDYTVSAVFLQSCSQMILTPMKVTTCQSKAGLTKGQMVYYPSDQLFQKCSEKASSDPEGQWEPGFCYCCCSSCDGNNLISVPGGVIPSKQLIKEQEIITASLLKPEPNLVISSAKIDFVQGIGEGVLQQLIYLVYGKRAEYQSICSVNQPFLLSSGKLVTADKLVPGIMNLLNFAGNALPIRIVGIGQYNTETYQIGLQGELNNSPSNHLLESNQTAVGDYKLQLNFENLLDDWKIERYEELTTIGSPEYLKHYRNLKLLTWDEIFTGLEQSTIGGSIILPLKEGFVAYGS